MNTVRSSNSILELINESIELPDSAYETAKTRYESIGEWLCRDKSVVGKNSPLIFPQGSFRLGTANRPIDNNQLYDLDLACTLRTGLSQMSATQKYLKELIGEEVEDYRKARNILEPLEEKHRCWRLNYKDQMSFHLDIVPSLPANAQIRSGIFEQVKRSGQNMDLSEEIAKLTLVITDNRHPFYSQISSDWKISNPEGYAKWFEARMNQRLSIYETREIALLPFYKRKTILQKAVQLLKRHRDMMFKNDLDAKPVSIALTTLAAMAYQGESELDVALINILSKMEGLINTSVPRIPNPVNPNEDFTDRWTMPQYKHLNLERNFFLWLQQAKSNFESICYNRDTDFIAKQAKRIFAVELNSTELERCLQSISFAPNPSNFPSIQVITDPPKPWSE